MMDAYDLYHELQKAWQQLGHMPDAGSINKKWNSAPVYVNDKIVTGVKIIDNKIILETE